MRWIAKMHILYDTTIDDQHALVHSKLPRYNTGRSKGPNIEFWPQVSTRDVNRGPIIESVGTAQFPVDCNLNEFSKGAQISIIQVLNPV